MPYPTRNTVKAAPPNTFRNLRTKTPSRAPFGSHVDISFGTEGRIARNYSLKLELNDDILSKDYQITLNGNKLSNSTKSTAYKADLPNNKGWVRVTLVANHPELFHAFVFHADEIDMIVVEPYETSELSHRVLHFHLALLFARDSKTYLVSLYFPKFLLNVEAVLGEEPILRHVLYANDRVHSLH